LRELNKHSVKKIDFLLYIGADTSDEPVLENLKQKITRASAQDRNSKIKKYFTSDCKNFLCVLGKKPSHASYYVEDKEQVAVLLNKMGGQT